MKQALRLIVSALALAGWGVSCQTPTPPPPSRQQPAKVAFMSDFHATRGTRDEQPKHAARLTKAIAGANAMGVDLVLVAGDLTENHTPEEWRDFRRQIKGFNAPVWFVPGNHDVGNKRLTGAQGEVTFGSVVDYELKFGRSYFVREHAGIRVIGLNTALFGSGLLKEKAMWRFLEGSLAKPSPLPTLVLLHHPPFVDTPDEKGGGYWNIEPEPRKRLLTLLKQGEATAVLSGHLHRPLRHEHQGILFLTVPGVAFGLPRDKQPPGWNLLHVSADSIEVQFQKIED